MSGVLILVMVMVTVHCSGEGYVMLDDGLSDDDDNHNEDDGGKLCT